MQKYYSRLKDLREDHDMTQAQVAEVIGTSQQHYGKYESGKIIIPFDRVIALAEFYNVSIDYIAGYTNDLANCKKRQKNKFSRAQQLSLFCAWLSFVNKKLIGLLAL